VGRVRGRVISTDQDCSDLGVSLSLNDISPPSYLASARLAAMVSTAAPLGPNPSG